jgi:hypothetical protein
MSIYHYTASGQGLRIEQFRKPQVVPVDSILREALALV